MNTSIFFAKSDAPSLYLVGNSFLIPPRSLGISSMMNTRYIKMRIAPESHTNKLEVFASTFHALGKTFPATDCAAFQKSRVCMATATLFQEINVLISCHKFFGTNIDKRSAHVESLNSFGINSPKCLISPTTIGIKSHKAPPTTRIMSVSTTMTAAMRNLTLF